MSDDKTFTQEEKDALLLKAKRDQKVMEAQLKIVKEDLQGLAEDDVVDIRDWKEQVDAVKKCEENIANCKTFITKMEKAKVVTSKPPISVAAVEAKVYNMSDFEHLRGNK